MDILWGGGNDETWQKDANFAYFENDMLIRKQHAVKKLLSERKFALALPNFIASFLNRTNF